MSRLIFGLISLLFFLSGAAALIYEVVWFRSFSLLFGASHLAVTTVLFVFMGGLALGSHLLGKRVERHAKPLRLYGCLELGIAVFAALFVLLMKLYPHVYVPLAQLGANNTVYLSSLRIVLAVASMLIPATLMGGTLPVLSGLVSSGPERLGARLSFLYGINTIGAVAGVLAAGFLLLPYLGVDGTITVAIGINLAIGLSSIALHETVSSHLVREAEDPRRINGMAGKPEPFAVAGSTTRIRFRLVLWGIGFSGFCALGYEVLWTRILSIVVGTTVYGFTIMLAAFLSGIASGSGACGLFLKFARGREEDRRLFTGFGLVQILIGATALLVTYTLRDLPAEAIRIQNLFLGTDMSVFEVRLAANILVAFCYMFLPAFFMGVAFPLAGRIHAEFRSTAGSSVGEVLTCNTIGAILGASLSGFALIYLFGIERSLQILVALNVGTGLLIAASTAGRPLVTWGTAAVTAAVLLSLALNPGRWKGWDTKYFAIYRNNQREAFDSPGKIEDAMENTDVLFFREGINETISAIKVKGATQALLVNGKVVASSMKQDIQCQMALGHLPVLLHANPRKVWVLGLGTGMTLGAVSVHPEVEKITLAEIEPNVVPAARMFRRFNHDVLDSPKLSIHYNDGRNDLLTTKEKYDVITADPIHPWARGSAYLYTTEYYRLAATRLLPGGIMCQWLPLYELTVDDLKSVVRTFMNNFRYAMLWSTHWDAELIGSNDPILIDVAGLERRISASAVAGDLKAVEMGSASDLLSYFVAGTTGLAEFSRDGTVNTDDNLYLEFSAPFSVGKNRMGRNAYALTRYRENLFPYLLPLKGELERRDQKARWQNRMEVAKVYDRAHARYLGGGSDTPEFRLLLARLETMDPGFAPARFLKREYLDELARAPKLLRQNSFALRKKNGEKTVLEISSVAMRIGPERAVVVFADNRAKIIYGQRYIDARAEEMERIIGNFVDGVNVGLEEVYRKDADLARAKGNSFPDLVVTTGRMRAVIEQKVRQITGDDGR